jgi:hypothetical protein
LLQWNSKDLEVGMSSEKNIGKKIADWFKDNTWIYRTVVTIGLALILAVVSINIGLGSSGSGDGNNIFNGGIDWEWSFDDEDSVDNSEETEKESTSSSTDTCKHSWKQIDKREPTCIEAGATKFECSYCGEERTSYVRAEGHDFYGGQCIKCGVQEE